MNGARKARKSVGGGERTATRGRSCRFPSSAAAAADHRPPASSTSLLCSVYASARSQPSLHHLSQTAAASQTRHRRRHDIDIDTNVNIGRPAQSKPPTDRQTDRQTLQPHCALVRVAPTRPPTQIHTQIQQSRPPPPIPSPSQPRFPIANLAILTRPCA